MKQLMNISSDELKCYIAGTRDTGKAVWDEVTKVENMPDQHLKNAVLKLMGFSTEEYEGDEILKANWITILKLEWDKRQKDRKSNFNRERRE